jgi:hypothetical protein
VYRLVVGVGERFPRLVDGLLQNDRDSLVLELEPGLVGIDLRGQAFHLESVDLARVDELRVDDLDAEVDRLIAEDLIDDLAVLGSLAEAARDLSLDLQAVYDEHELGLGAVLFERNFKNRKPTSKKQKINHVTDD